MRTKANLWNPVILIPAGVIVAIVGLVFWLQAASRKKRYTGEATAEILSVKRSSHYSNGVTRHVYTPTVAYTVDGNRYEVKGQGSGQSDYYLEGAQIAVRYNPQKPDKCLTITAQESQRGANITMLIGAGIVLLGVIAMLTR